MRALRERDLTSLQTVYNLLEQEPGAEFLRSPRQRGAGVIARVPTSSGLMEDNLTPDHNFTGNDHRRHRPRSWLVEGLQKIDQLRFLQRDGERTLAQAAYRFILAQPAIGCVVHTVNTVAQLQEWAAAAPTGADLDEDELARVDELYAAGFGLARLPDRGSPRPTRRSPSSRLRSCRRRGSAWSSLLPVRRIASLRPEVSCSASGISRVEYAFSTRGRSRLP